MHRTRPSLTELCLRHITHPKTQRELKLPLPQQDGELVTCF